MRLLSFHADGFGILAQTGAEDLGPGINIFLGDNEAGKSTCLAFLRAMLTGYPSGRKERQAGQPLRGGQAGGSLTLESGLHGLLHLHRRPGPGSGRLQLTGPDGAPVPESLLEQLFRGIDRQVYSNVFGFSLGELQRFESLDDEAVRHALYGASFGTSLRSPADVLRALQQQADAIYRPQGRKLPLNVQAGCWQELRARIRQADARSGSYDALCAQWQQRKQDLEDLRRRKTELETALRRTERRLSVWEQWREWHLLGMRLERLSGLPQDFPPQGRERLARLREREEEGQHALQGLREQCARTRERLRELCPDQALVAALPRLRALTEQTSTYRQALTDLPLARLRKEQIARRLQEELSRLGPDWDCARIRATDRSVFGREEVERQAATLATCTTALQMARQREDEAAAALAQAEETHQAHLQRLEALPDRQPPLDGGQQRHLQRLLENWQEKQGDLPRWQRRQQRAREAFSRACAPLRLDGNDLAGPERLLRHKDEALSLASRLDHLTERLRSLREQQDHARQEQDKLQQRETALVQAIDRHPALEQEALDRFAAAVRHCRTLRSGIAAETVRQEGLSQQAQQLERPLTGGSLPLLCMGIVLLLPGLVLLLAGQWAPELLPWPGLATSPWAGGLAAVCGLALLAGGLPHAGKAERHRREEAARIRQLLEESTGRLREQQHRLARLPLPRSMNNDIPDADELESCLEKQQAARRQLDQLLQEHDSLRQELRRVRQTLARLAEQEQELLAAIQDGENRWQAMLPAATATAFAPAAAGLLFERAATAAALAEALRAAGDDAGHATSSLQQTEQALRDLLALLPPDAACPSLPEAVRRGLALCREAEVARAGHSQAAAEAATSAGLLEHCRKVLEDSRCRTQEAALRLETARTAWTGGLHSLGLPEDLTPGTVHAALDGMESCLRLEEELQQEDSRLQRLHGETEALRAPLAALLEETGRPVPPQDADWLRHLEMLGEAAEDARHRAAEQARLRQLLDEQETACRRAASDLDNIRTDLAALLHQGGARDDGDFLQTAALLEERHRTEQRRLLLEDSLRLVAGTQPLETFLASFREEAREEEEQACAGQQHLLEGLRQEEDALAEEVAALGVRVEAMRQDGTLADLLQQEADQREELQRQARAWCRLRLAHALLHRAKLAFEKERQPRVIRRAAAIFRDITAGAWQDVGAVVGDSSLRVMPPQGEPVSPEQLSRGTQEQLYLALRLAYIQDHAAQASPLPVIMDDVLVDFDPGRARRTARILGDLSQGRYGPRQQILFFTCHPHTAALLREVQPSAPLFLLDKGQLRPAGPEGAEEVPLRP